MSRQNRDGSCRQTDMALELGTNSMGVHVCGEGLSVKAFRMNRRPGNSDPTPEEHARMMAAKQGPCIPCLAGVMGGVIEPEHACRGGHNGEHDLPMMEYNHTKSGNIRRGHAYGFAACTWHHHGSQQLHALGLSYDRACERWGPNLFDHAKTFHKVFGTDDELIELQTEVLKQLEAA